LGLENDTINATGYIAGYVKNSNDTPLEGVQVLCGSSTTTNSSGFFMFSEIAWKRNIIFSKQNYITQDTLVQVYPESTITINVRMSPIVSVERIETQTVPKDFSISEPFPNPFNPETQIQYTLPKNGNVEIEVFDIGGRLVDKIFSGYQSKGSYQARWNAIHLSSGIYIIRIQTGESVLSKKCLLAK
jgi:hypothetical protein